MGQIFPIIGQFIVIYTLAPYTNKDNTKFVFSNGQFLLFKRSVYEKIGTHEAVKKEIIEDFHLAKLVKQNGYKVRVYNGLNLLKVRMYRNLKEMIQGWSKNLYLGLGAKIYYLIIAILLLTIIYLFPFITLFYSLYFYYNYTNLFIWSLIINIFYIFRFGIIYYKLNVNFNYAFQYFISIILFIYLLLKSYIMYKKGILWKGRIYKIST
jgi:chlorobactene glucosyltransferase